MSMFDDNIKGILKKILSSYNLIKNLEDKSVDLEIIKIELAKINGLMQVLGKKIDSINNNSNSFVSMRFAIANYLSNYDFSREIEMIDKLYSDDPHRLKNLRYVIINALEEQNLIEKITSTMNEQ